MADYAFGDTQLAANRLALLADVFAESSRAFMLESIDSRPQMAADLGCGPGYTTHLAARTLNPRHTAGLDSSESFLTHAGTTATERVSFHLHDITKIPFPIVPSDVMFGRFLLTHLRDPEEMVSLWGSQLRVHGRLLMEEVEYVDTTDPIVTSYLDMQHAMLKEKGNSLYIGPQIHKIAKTSTMKRRTSNVQTLAIPADKAAAMFLMNFSVWRSNKFLQRNYGPEALDEVETHLRALTEDRDSKTPVEWGLRQVVMERGA